MTRGICQLTLGWGMREQPHAATTRIFVLGYSQKKHQRQTCKIGSSSQKVSPKRICSKLSPTAGWTGFVCLHRIRWLRTRSPRTEICCRQILCWSSSQSGGAGHFAVVCILNHSFCKVKGVNTLSFHMDTGQREGFKMQFACVKTQQVLWNEIWRSQLRESRLFCSELLCFMVFDLSRQGRGDWFVWFPGRAPGKKQQKALQSAQRSALCGRWIVLNFFFSLVKWRWNCSFCATCIHAELLVRLPDFVLLEEGKN